MPVAKMKTSRAEQTAAAAVAINIIDDDPRLLLPTTSTANYFSNPATHTHDEIVLAKEIENGNLFFLLFTALAICEFGSFCE